MIKDCKGIFSFQINRLVLGTLLLVFLIITEIMRIENGYFFLSISIHRFQFIYPAHLKDNFPRGLGAIFLIFCDHQ